MNNHVEWKKRVEKKLCSNGKNRHHVDDNLKLEEKMIRFYFMGIKIATV